MRNTWVKSVDFMCTRRRKTSDYSSTDKLVQSIGNQNESVQPKVILYFMNTLVAALSTPLSAYLPQVNTICTQFPQHLLLEPRKKIKKGNT